MRATILFCAALLALAACERTPADRASAADTVAGTAFDSAGPARADSVAAGSGYHREHAIDLTGDGRTETVIASAEGVAYDSLDVAVTIVNQRGDTLWHETWPSLLYFKYDPLEGKADSTVMRIVQNHLDELVEPSRFTISGGLPPELSRGGDTDALMREAVRYHLAELDYRLRSDLTPSAATPASAFERINVEHVSPVRVNAVVTELRQQPSFWYYAGGEATYAIAWSARESAFIRIHSCC